MTGNTTDTSRPSGRSVEELRRIAGTDDLHVAPFREDGMTYGVRTLARQETTP